MRIYKVRRTGSHDTPRTCVAADDLHAAAMIGCTPGQCEIQDVTAETLAKIDPPTVTVPVLRFSDFVGARQQEGARRAPLPPAPPSPCRCCDRPGEYNGEGSQAAAFSCPIACICHD